MAFNRPLARSLTLSQRGQFIPMAAMVMLSITVFMVGAVNVYRISRAKLKAQNLADAVALYIGSQMTQSMNHVADRNEWLNILYANANNPNANSADSDPCIVPPNSPPGLGCFAKKGGSPYQFTGKQAVQSYARLVQTINQIQQLFSNSYNTLLGAGYNAPSNGQSSLYTNLLHNIPALNDPGVQLVIFNSAYTKSIADSVASQQAAQNPSTASTSQNAGTNQNALVLNNLEQMQFTVKNSISVNYCKNPLNIGGCDQGTINLEDSLGSSGQKIGVMGLADPTPAGQTSAYLDSQGSIGAGAIVTVPVTLIGLSATSVQAKATAYVVRGSGSLDPDALGRFSPTYWVKLGKPT